MPDEYTSAATSARHSKLLIATACCLTLGSVIGGIIRFGPRDEVQSLAVLFYATPQLVLTAAAVLSVVLVRKQKTKLAWPIISVAIIQCCLLLPAWNRPGVETQPKGSVTLGFWNVGGGGLGWNGIAKQTKSWNADIIGLAESNVDTVDGSDHSQQGFWENQFPQHTILQFPRGMRLITKYPARLVSEGELAERSHYGIAEVQINGEAVNVVMADLLSGPQRPRGPSFDALIDVLDSLPQGPVILMGDMNTPTESVHINALRGRLGNAFEEQGHGFYCTWPTPCPVLALDQVWTNDAVEIASCELEWTMHSDHRPMVSTFNLKPDRAPRLDFQFTTLTRLDSDDLESHQTQGGLIE
ncbi:MAG: endonuclease/exonuclease/phosphatase family protein [Planctomycetaceae bacterium]